MKFRQIENLGLLFLAVTFCGIPIGAHAAPAARENAGASGFQMLEEPVTPRQVAMGSAGTAAPGGSFAYYNPALPFLQPRPSVTVEYGQHGAADFHLANFETTWRIKDFFTGLSLHSQSVVDIIPTSINGANYNTPGSSQTTALSINAGYAFGPAAIALSFNGVQDRIFNDAAYALTLSGGAVWAPIPDKLSLGISAFHWGRTTSYLDTMERFEYNVQLPQSGRLGATWHDRLRSLEYSASLDVVYRRTDGRFMIPVGVEIWPVEALAIRMGKRIFHDVDQFTLGCGLRLAPVTVDISFVIPSYEGDSELKWLMGVTYALKKQAALPSVKKPAAAAAPVAVPLPLAPAAKASAPVVPDSIAAKDPSGASPAVTQPATPVNSAPAPVAQDSAGPAAPLQSSSDNLPATAESSLQSQVSRQHSPAAADSARAIENPPETTIPATEEDAR